MTIEESQSLDSVGHGDKEAHPKDLSYLQKLSRGISKKKRE